MLRNKNLLFPLIYGLVFLLSLYVVLQYLIYKPSQSAMVSAKLEDASFPYRIWEAFFYPHILLGLAALLIGAYQLTRRSRRNPLLHKRLGRIYGASIFLNALAVPYISLYATGGVPSTVAFLILDFCAFPLHACIQQRHVSARRVPCPCVQPRLHRVLLEESRPSAVS